MKIILKRLYKTALERLRSADYRIVIAIVLVGLFVLYLFVERVSLSDEALYIAVAGPTETPDGKAMVRGIELLIDEENRKGRIGGKPIKLLRFDDQGIPKTAKQQAQEIVVHEKNILLVLGHYYSATSFASGEIYQNAGIPAITASALANEVTEGNPWYFRTTFNNRSQAAFLANYVKKILHHETASIIYSRDPYGRSLAENFEQIFHELGGTIAYIRNYDPEDKELDKNLEDIVEELFHKGEQKPPGILFLATRESESVKIVVSMKRRGMNYPVIGDDWTINEKFAEYPEEQETSGYFSDGIYAAVPILFDVAGKKAQQFQEDFRAEHGQNPGITAAMYYDAAKVAVHAIKKLKLQGKQKYLAKERRKLRDYLASIRSLNDAIDGIAGPIYFDKEGTLAGDRAPTMGVFHNQALTPALTQFTPVTDLKRIVDLEQELAAERVLHINNRYMYKTNLVHTGVEIHHMSDLNFQELSYLMDFYLWFRYQGQFDEDDIEFLNTAKPIQLNLIAERMKDGVTYRLYHVTGRFKADFLSDIPTPGQHVLGVSFRHRQLTRNNLVYKVDRLGMKQGLDTMKQMQILDPGSGWEINDTQPFEDCVEKSTMGDPAYLKLSKQSREYSRFNTGIWIKRTVYPLRRVVSVVQRFIPVVLTPVIVIVSGILLILLELATKRKVYKRRLLRFWQAVLLVVLLLFSEGFFVNWLGNKIFASLGTLLYTYYLHMMTLTFEILWFVVPAFLLTMMIAQFLWNPLENRTGHAVPRVIRHSVVYVVYILTVFGILAYVFGKDITALAATSGIVAILLGFASRIDISNIFAGIGISLTQPFRIGDWVKINELEEGKVIDMTSRVTKIETRDRTMLSIPNTVVAGGVIENYNYPDEHYRIKFRLQTAPIYRYERVEKVLLDAVLSTEGVLKDPAPEIIFQGQGDSCTIYSVHFYVNDYSKRTTYTRAVWRRVWRHLELAGIELATPRREVLMVKKAKEDMTDPLPFLRHVSIFQPLSDEAKSSLSERVRRHCFVGGETIFHQGESGDSLFIIAEGAVGMWLQFEDGRAIEVARMGVADFFGEMELLSGEARKSSAVAIVDTNLFELTREDLAPFLEENPQISELLNRMMAEREATMENQKDLYQLEEIEKDAPSTKLLQKTKEILGGKK